VLAAEGGGFHGQPFYEVATFDSIAAKLWGRRWAWLACARKPRNERYGGCAHSAQPVVWRL
jgi:hypothetical protein